jgi:hypothetical protein
MEFKSSTLEWIPILLLEIEILPTLMEHKWISTWMSLLSFMIIGIISIIVPRP